MEYMSANRVEELAFRNQNRAWEIITDTGVEDIWRSAGVEPRLVGSLKTGLLVKHRDIDFHVYSNPVVLADDFAAMARLAEHPAIKRIEFADLLDTDECCVEWHAYYLDRDGELWQIDMIHILGGSCYDGYFERMAERISEVLTPETRETILSLKYATPDGENIMGVEYYQAVLRDGVRTYPDFMAWRKEHPETGVVEWIP
ncbi:hypothetical protein [Butyricimonas synergistica]|uniref:hypothetical protein n=1 Tax=Butyricimonas synergistica TaxID=544644 RepID=UPI00036E88A1